MSALTCRGLDGMDPLGFLAALGLLRVVSREVPETRLEWIQAGTWNAILHTEPRLDFVEVVLSDLERWRQGHPALEFAVGAHRKVQDLKHPPGDFRTLMRESARDMEAAPFIAAYATGVAIDGTGQTKPTSFHFSAGNQLFLNAVLDMRATVTDDDLTEALHGPWIGRTGTKDTRWRAASDRNRALLGFDPSKDTGATLPGAAWLAFQAMPLFPAVPIRDRIVTTGFTGRGRNERFTWPIWTSPLSMDAVRVLLATPNLAETNMNWRRVRGVAQVLESRVVRSAQGYGNFASPAPR